MRVFVAGGTGVIGRRLVPQLVARGHQVTATTSAARLGSLEKLGAHGVVMDGLDAVSVGEAVAAAAPDTVVNQMTALSVAHAGKPNLRKAAVTSRHRSASGFPISRSAPGQTARRVPAWLARLLAGEMMVHDDPGARLLNAKAKREFGWQLRYPSWRQGFRKELA
jgi:NAD dependent epimerase/dehydratase family